MRSSARPRKERAGAHHGVLEEGVRVLRVGGGRLRGRGGLLDGGVVAQQVGVEGRRRVERGPDQVHGVDLALVCPGNWESGNQPSVLGSLAITPISKLGNQPSACLPRESSKRRKQPKRKSAIGRISRRCLVHSDSSEQQQSATHISFIDFQPGKDWKSIDFQSVQPPGQCSFIDFQSGQDWKSIDFQSVQPPGQCMADFLIDNLSPTQGHALAPEAAIRLPLDNERGPSLNRLLQYAALMGRTDSARDNVNGHRFRYSEGA